MKMLTNKIYKLSLIIVFIFLSLFLTSSYTFAVDVGDADVVTPTNQDCAFKNIIFLNNFCNNTGATNDVVKDVGGTTNSIITNVLNGFFIIVLLVAVFYTLKAALTYVRSEGDEKKVGQAKASLRGIVFGVVFMFAALIALVFLGSLAGNSESGLSKSINCSLEPVLKIFGVTPNATSCSTTP